MKHNEYEITVKVWLYPGGTASWHFVTVPRDVSQDIKHLFGDQARGFGSLPVRVTIGATVWNTSIFPDTKEGAYILPIKADVRKKEGISKGDTVTIQLEVNP